MTKKIASKEYKKPLEAKEVAPSGDSISFFGPVQKVEGYVVG